MGVSNMKTLKYEDLHVRHVFIFVTTKMKTLLRFRNYENEDPS